MGQLFYSLVTFVTQQTGRHTQTLTYTQLLLDYPQVLTPELHNPAVPSAELNKHPKYIRAPYCGFTHTFAEEC